MLDEYLLIYLSVDSVYVNTILCVCIAETLLACIQEAFGLNLSRDTGYPD
jgi:hypothetical protein